MRRILTQSKRLEFPQDSDLFERYALFPYNLNKLINSCQKDYPQSSEAGRKEIELS